jgi:hypothetical protein
VHVEVSKTKKPGQQMKAFTPSKKASRFNPQTSGKLQIPSLNSQVADQQPHPPKRLSIKLGFGIWGLGFGIL